VSPTHSWLIAEVTWESPETAANTEDIRTAKTTKIPNFLIIHLL